MSKGKLCYDTAYMNTKKQTILIAGGSDGLGKAVAKLLAKKHHVIIMSNDEKGCHKTASELSCDFAVADISNYDEVSDTVNMLLKKYKKIDCVINSAGIYLSGHLDQHDPNHIKKLIDVNVVGAMYLVHALLPYFKKQKKGKIIHVISQNGLMSKADRSVYTASKWAINGFTKCLHEDLIPYNISVSGIFPGLMKTKLFSRAGATRDTSKAMDPIDVAKAIEFVVELKDSLHVPEFGIKPTWY